MRPSKYGDKTKKKSKKKKNVFFAQQSDQDGTDNDAGSTSDFGFVQVAKYVAKAPKQRISTLSSTEVEFLGLITDDNFGDCQDLSYSFM